MHHKRSATYSAHSNPIWLCSLIGSDRVARLALLAGMTDPTVSNDRSDMTDMLVGLAIEHEVQ